MNFESFIDTIQYFLGIDDTRPIQILRFSLRAFAILLIGLLIVRFNPKRLLEKFTPLTLW